MNDVDLTVSLPIIGIKICIRSAQSQRSQNQQRGLKSAAGTSTSLQGKSRTNGCIHQCMQPSFSISKKPNRTSLMPTQRRQSHSPAHHGCLNLLYQQYTMVATEFTEEERRHIILKSKSSSSPSSADQVFYVVLKKCPSLIPALLHIFKSCWILQKVPDAWKVGVICLLGKKKAEDDPSKPNNFRAAH